MQVKNTAQRFDTLSINSAEGEAETETGAKVA